jgi:D-3-phosphoglycerate dehydrogenase
MIKVLITDKIEPEGLTPISGDKSFNLVYIKDDAQLKAEIADADALLVRSKTKVNPELLALAKKLRYVGRAGVGVETIDVPATSKKGIVVANVPGGNTISAAEHTFALMLAVSRNIPQADAVMKQGGWSRDKFVGAELMGKTLGLIGFGRIGKEVAKRAIAFDMQVIAYDPFVTAEHMQSFGVKYDTVENVLKQADYISLHIPSNDQTKKIINAESLAKMKPEARLINCARGALVDEAALIEALKAKKIKAAALDVYTEEPNKNMELTKLENIILTPHLGASTEEAQLKVAIELSACMKEFFEKGVVRNAVNLPSVDKETMEKSAPYAALAEKLGKFVSQITEGGIKEVQIEFAGEFTSAVRNILTLAAVKGTLARTMDEAEVNWVNALPIAKERGIKIEEVSVSELQDYTSLITIKMITDKGTRSVSGTILAAGRPRIVRIDGLPVDVLPEGKLVVYTNVDQPGIVGFIGTLLGENKINIAAFQVGRKAAGGEAVSILNVDSPVTPEMVQKIRSFKGINQVWVVNL